MLETGRQAAFPVVTEPASNRIACHLSARSSQGPEPRLASLEVNGHGYDHQKNLFADTLRCSNQALNVLSGHPAKRIPIPFCLPFPRTRPDRIPNQQPLPPTGVWLEESDGVTQAHPRPRNDWSGWVSERPEVSQKRLRRSLSRWAGHRDVKTGIDLRL